MRRPELKFPKDSILSSRKIKDISGWRVHEDEWAGAKPKKTISPPNTNLQYMVKFPKQGSRRGGHVLDEVRVELFNCYLGLNLGLNMALYFPCTYKGQYGIVTKSFLRPTHELWEMKDLICRHSSNENLKELRGRDVDVLKEHDIQNIFMILEEETKTKTSATPNKVARNKGEHSLAQQHMFKSFFKMIGFDCLIGYTDRHWSNYGLLLAQDLKLKFAPIYDTSSGYLLEKTETALHHIIEDNELDDPTWSWYQPRKKGICKITCNKDIKTNHLDLFKHILDNPIMARYKQDMLEPIQKISLPLVHSLLDYGCLKDFSDSRKYAIIKVLSTRRTLLNNIASSKGNLK